MTEQIKITLTHSPRRPAREAWCARSDGHTTYAATEAEALERHKAALDAHNRMVRALKLCAAGVTVK